MFNLNISIKSAAVSVLTLFLFGSLYAVPSCKAEMQESAPLIDKLEPMPLEESVEEDQEESEKEAESKKKITVFEDQDDEELSARKGVAKIYLTIAVPHNKKAVIKVEAFPYPPKLPKRDWVAELPESEKDLRDLLISHGYLGRSSADHPYPPGGWRFQYALAKAVKKSKMSVPHTIFQHYGWADKMVPILKPEIETINEYEKKRSKAYDKYQQFWTDNHSVLRGNALRNNFEKVKFLPLPKEGKKVGQNFGGVLKDGKWWILATQKVPGLTYNWIKEVDLKDNDRLIIVLNEANALFINGGW